MIFLISKAMFVLSKIVAKTMLQEKLPFKYDIIKIRTWKIAISFDISMLKLTSYYTLREDPLYHEHRFTFLSDFVIKKVLISEIRIYLKEFSNIKVQTFDTKKK